MNLLGGKSYNDGIDFSFESAGKKQVISAKRLENGEIITSIKNDYTNVKRFSAKRNIISAISSILIVGVAYFLKYHGIELSASVSCIGVLFVFWTALTAFCYHEGKKESNDAVTKYHSAEHKVLNYYYRKFELPSKVDDIELEQNIYVFCGATVIVAMFMCISLIALSIFVFQIRWSIGIIVSSLLTVFLLAKGKCNFIQKFFLKTPTRKELEVAIQAMNALAEFEKDVQTNEIDK